MKRKRQESDDGNSKPAKRFRSEAISIRGSDISISNIYILFKFLGPFCLQVQEKLAVPKDRCKVCQEKTYEENDNPFPLKKNIHETSHDGYLVDTLIQDLFHRGGPEDISSVTEDSSVKYTFSCIKHIPWLASHLLMSHLNTMKISLNVGESALMVQWFPMIKKEKQLEHKSLLKDTIEGMHKLIVKKKLEELLNH